MKIIISHDIDHITAKEHVNDMIIPKFIIRNKIELFTGKISFKEFNLRLKNILKNKWNNISEIMDYNEHHDIPETFFMGVNNGVGLYYGLDLAELWVNKILKRGVDCGVHGISYNNYEEVKREYDLFQQISGLEHFGIRMHYLRNDSQTFENLANAGYIFDSTDYGIKKHYKIKNMHEFPLHIMEGYELEAGKKWQSKSTSEAVSSAIEKIKNAEKDGISYLTILFHDRYFDDSFLSWKNWYKAITDYCKAQSYEFVDYRGAIKEINSIDLIK